MVLSAAILPPGFHARATPWLALVMAHGQQRRRRPGVCERWLNGGIHASNLQQLLRDAGPPEYIFHLAGGSSVGASIDNPYEDFTRTVATTAELLEWMRLAARTARLVSVSSAAVYGAGHTGPIREEQALLPFSPYGYHKLMMENVMPIVRGELRPGRYGGAVVLGVRQLAEEAGVVGYVLHPGFRHAAIGAGWHGRGVARLDRHPGCGARFRVHYGPGNGSGCDGDLQRGLGTRDKRRQHCRDGVGVLASARQGCLQW